MKTFVIAIDGASDAQLRAITLYYKGTPYGYWHWMPNFWILQSPEDNVTAPQVRDTIQSLAPGLSCIVLAVDPLNDWAGWGYQGWREWLDKSWKERGT